MPDTSTHLGFLLRLSVDLSTPTRRRRRVEGKFFRATDSLAQTRLAHTLRPAKKRPFTWTDSHSHCEVRDGSHFSPPICGH